MKSLYKKWIFFALFAVLCIEIIAVNVYLSRISELRSSVVPAARKDYRESREKLNQIREYKKKFGEDSQGQKGVPLQGQFREWARQAGIEEVPEVRQSMKPGGREKDKVHLSVITVRGVKADPLFKFLRILDETGSSNRIERLTIHEQRGKPNEFYLVINFATYMRPYIQEKKLKKNQQ